tara:strand:+ start:13244 stop:13852 length:609 start_codon:yes stop_codon:yes gene_type:complete
VNPLIILISGPSGVGKDSLINKLREDCDFISIIVTVTTRKIRDGETNGKDYVFVNQETFNQMKISNAFLECANVYGNQYGVPKDAVKSALCRGQDALIKADIQGANAIMNLEPSVLSIFIMPDSTSDLENRLKKRMTESKKDLKLRLDTAKNEIDQAGNFDFIVYNKEHRIDETLKQIQEIILEAKNSKTKRVFNITNETTI